MRDPTYIPLGIRSLPTAPRASRGIPQKVNFCIVNTSWSDKECILIGSTYGELPVLKLSPYQALSQAPLQAVVSTILRGLS